MVDSTTTDTVTIRQFTFRMILRNIDNQIELVFGNHLHHVVLRVRTFIGPVNSFSAHSMSIQESGCTCRCINLISFIEEHAAGLQQIDFRFHGTGREHHSLLRNLEASSNHGAQQCFGEIITDTATPATSQTIPETTTEPEPEKLTCQTGLYQEKTLADQVSVDAARELPEGEYGVLSYSYDETVSVWGNGAEDCLVIHDGDEEYRVEIPWQNMYSAPPAVEAADYDGDGDKEYYISTIQGTGTGVYVEGLYYVDVQKGTPKVSEYTNVVEDFESRILAADTLDEQFHTLHVDFLDKNGESDPEESIDLSLDSLLREYEGNTYMGTVLGDQIRFDFRGGTPFASVVVGIQLYQIAIPLYDSSFRVTAPVSMQENGKFSLGNFSVRTNPYDVNVENADGEEQNMTEVYTGYYDLTHNGYKEKVVTKVYLEEENGALTEALRKAGNWGTVEVYEYLGDGQYGIIPLWSQEFAIAHAGNVQIFLTQKDGYDYLVTTSLWSGQGVCYYDYNVLSPVNYSFDRYHNELKGADHYDPQFFTGLESWLKEDSLLLVATDIDMPQGQEVILTTDEETHYAEEYLMVKKERLQSVEDID